MSGRADDAWLPARADIYRTPKAVQFVDAEGFLAVALKAYMAAARGTLPPDREPWQEDGASWCNAEDFCRHLVEQVAEGLRRAAIASGDLREVPWTAEQYAEYEADQAWMQERAEALATPGCRGGAPAVEGHGCPALSSAVGPAPTSLPSGAGGREARTEADITFPDDRFSAASGGKSCRVDDEPATVAHLRGNTP